MSRRLRRWWTSFLSTFGLAGVSGGWAAASSLMASSSERPAAVAAAALGFVQAEVGATEQQLGRLAAVVGGDAGREGDAQVGCEVAPVELGHHAAGAGDGVQRGVGAGAVEDHQ